MPPREWHRWDIRVEHDTQVVRYVCPQCGRCMEDRPEGLVLLERGDPSARHGGGELSDVATELSASAPPPPTH